LVVLAQLVLMPLAAGPSPRMRDELQRSSLRLSNLNAVAVIAYTPDSHLETVDRSTFRSLRVD
jgi:hypothetical protein